MPRGKSNKDAVSPSRNPTVSAAAVGGHLDSVPSVSGVPSSNQRKGTALEALQLIFADDAGWLRAVPQDDGSVIFFKWKWARGKFKNNYVMYRCDDYDISTALWGLLDKMEKVRVGILRPTPDTPYD